MKGMNRMNILALTQTELDRLCASGILHRPTVQCEIEKPRKEYTFKPETLAKMAAARSSRADKRTRNIARQRAEREAFIARGLTSKGKVRKAGISKHKCAVNALLAGLVGYLSYEDRTGRTCLYMAAKRMGVKLRFANGKCTLDNTSAIAHTPRRKSN